MQTHIVDGRTGLAFTFLDSSGGAYGGFGIPGLNRKTIARSYGKDMFDEKSLPPDPDHAEIVLIQAVYKGSMFVEATVDEMGLLPDRMREGTP